MNHCNQRNALFSCGPCLRSNALTVLSVVFTLVCYCSMSRADQPLIDGDVEILYETRRDLDREGVTEFYLQWNYEFTFRYQFLPALSGPPDQVTVRALVQADASVAHTIRLPSSGRNQAWFRRLMDHEMDHVMVSADPRPVAMFKGLVAEFSFQLVLADDERGLSGRIDERVAALVDAEIASIGNAVSGLIQWNYDRLDHLTHHGLKPLPSRGAFFSSLYSYPTIALSDFQYLDELGALIAAGRIREI